MLKTLIAFIVVGLTVGLLEPSEPDPRPRWDAMLVEDRLEQDEYDALMAAQERVEKQAENTVGIED